MTNHDLISSYIDNELSREQEQEFLIKLAANDNLRNSFRTELTLKNIVQRDESLITPPRALRASVFAAIGLSATESAQAASTQAATTIAASQPASFFKTLFATKLNTAFTTLGLSIATIFGYVGHDMLSNEPVAPVQAVQPAITEQPVLNTIAPVVTPAEKPVAQSVARSAVKTKIRTTQSLATKAPATEKISSSKEAPQSNTTIGSEPSVFGSGEGEMQSKVKKSEAK